MADKKISQLTSATLPLAGTEVLPMVQGGQTVKALQADLFQWPTGRVTYVPIGGDIQAAVTAATAGDTLILGAGSYPITATITVDKAILIKGQGLSATKVTTATADIAAFTLTASSARITDLYIGHSGTGTTYGIYAGDGLTGLQVRNVTVVTSGAGVKFCIYSKSSITVSDTECYPTSSDSNSNGVYITNDSGATVNISANVQGVRVIATGVTSAANGNRGLVAYNNNTVKTITVNLFNSQLTAVASAGSTDVALYATSTTTFNTTVNAYDSVLSGADTDVVNTGTNVLTLSNCTLVNGTTTGTITYGGTQVVAKLNGNTITKGTGVLTLAAGKTLTANNTLTLAGTDATTQTFPATSATIARTDAAQTFTGTQTFNGLVNIGGTARTWSTDYAPVIQVGLGGSLTGNTVATNENIAMFAANYYQNAGGVDKYIANGKASAVQLFNGNLILRTAISGIAGNTLTWVDGLTVSNANIVTMSAYGAGAATFSAAGVISSVSDETWKIKDGVPTNPDAMLKKLEPGYWYYNEDKKETFGEERQLGFYAQNVNFAIGPEAAPRPHEGKPWGYYDRSVLAVTVMSLKNALNTIENLTARLGALEAKCL